ncbi:MAG TPA: YciI family protein [Gaiellaceae bacterium]|nr:YciI family protein [Gaiellaceae bacterium]
MRYLALIHSDEEAWAALPDDERSAIYARYRAFADEARAAGKLVEGYELRPTATATTVRVVAGETVVTDGPFAELREQIAGYFILDCESLDEAVALAARIPGAEHGAVEVRPGYVEEEAA